jgi:2-(1,2-epoxy-1,2-dihydrophenyl)acetyl-CoA isomerase
MHYQTMQFETFDAIAVVTMNRPQAANTVTQLLAEELSDVAVQCASDARIRSVILTGTGRFFPPEVT